MSDFYFQIKGKLASPETNGFGLTNWGFPPLFSGKVTAKDKKEAKLLVDEEYGKKFPQRVLAKDLDSNEFLLNLEEIKEGSHYYKLFEKQTCTHCSDTFYVIDKYNDQNSSYKGFEFCSDKCKNERRNVEAALRNAAQVLAGSSVPVIYKITNKHTGMCYIGKTTQVFTLRWYQHFFQGGDNKFHTAIKNSKLSDWVFEIQEIVELPKDVKIYAEIEKVIIGRERHWIKEHNSIEKGYNSII